MKIKVGNYFDPIVVAELQPLFHIVVDHIQ